MRKTNNRYLSILIYLSLSATTIVAFEGVRKCDFVYDDRVCVLENEFVKAGLTAKSIIWAFTNPHLGNWHPLTSITHILDCQFFGLNPAGPHITNLVIHTINVLLVFGLLKTMTGAPWRSFFVAALFAVHPLRVESVAWISERKDVMSGLFWLVTIAAYIRYTKKRSIANYLLVLAGYAAALMSKPMVVTLPFVLLLLDYWPLGIIKGLPHTDLQIKTDPKPFSKLVLEKLPLLIPAAAVSVITFLIQYRCGAAYTLKNLPVSPRIANALIAYAGYLGKMFWPAKLAAMYPHPLKQTPLLQAIVPLLLLGVISVFVIRLTRRRGYMLTGWLWYLGTLVPVIGLVQVGSQSMADRYTYLPSIGIGIMFVWGLTDVTSRLANQRMIAAAGGTALLAALVVCTRLQVAYWKNNVSLYGHAVAVTKNNHIMQNNYGAALFDTGRYDEAFKHYSLAFQIEPKYFDARINAGKALLAQKKFSQGAQYFKDLLKLKPDHIEINVLLAKILLVDLGDVNSAVKQYRQILEIKPDQLEALNNLAWLMATSNDPNLKNPSEAIEFAFKACQVTEHKDAESLDTLAAAYAAAGRFDEAVATAQKALELADSNNETELVEQIKQRLDLYNNNQPFIDDSLLCK
jgi:cytochrome c-type biogenesis protein CcmH/NrfG